MIINYIDKFLNTITMYRLVLYGLTVLSGISFIFSLFGLLPFTFIQLIVTMAIIFIVGFFVKVIMHAIFKPVANFESAPITSFILFFILAPVTNITDVWITVLATTLAISSKFLLAIDKKHIFNPAALGVFLLGLLGYGNAIWWVGSTSLLPFVAVLGLLVVRKLRKFHLLWSFLIASIVTIIAFNVRNGVSPDDSFIQAFLSWPLVFFATIMVTEPLTSPHRKKLTVLYGLLVGVFFGSQFHIGPFFSSPELSLLIGNIFAFIVNPKYRLFLQLKERIQLAPNIYEFVFEKVSRFTFLPGQYLEWTVPDTLPDARGNRRYFTIASSPTEDTIKVGVKFSGDKSSSFKKKLLNIIDGQIVASQLNGDFVLPVDKSQKLVFIAGGIGITPFRSMVHYLLDTNEKRDILLFYACSSQEEFVYEEIFAKAEKELGIKVIYIITHKDNVPSQWKGETGYLSEEMIQKYVADSKERIYFISGPNTMVEAYKKVLRKMNIRRSSIVTDYFPGF